MRALKKFGVFLGIGLLIFIAFVIFGNYISPTNSVSAPKISPPTQQIQKQEAPPPRSEISFEGTKKIGAKIADSLIDLNRDEGPVDIDNKKMIRALNPQKLADEIVKTELGQISALDIGLQDIELKAIKVSETVSAQTYLRQFQQIMNHNFTTAEVDLNNFITIYDKTIDDFYNLAVPPALADIHKQQILLLSQQKIIFSKLRDAEANPLEALAALQKSGEIDLGFSQLKNKILEFVEKNNISI